MPSTLELRNPSRRADVPLTSLDPVQVEQVLLNLCINARDAMQGHGRDPRRRRAGRERAAASARPAASTSTASFVELAVRDNGPGIPPEVMERMFEPFFSTKEVGKGSGMGLATVHGIVHEHGGHIAGRQPCRASGADVPGAASRCCARTAARPSTQTLPGYGARVAQGGAARPRAAWWTTRR